MNRNNYLQLLLCLLITGCMTTQKRTDKRTVNQQFEVKSSNLNFYDKSRNRLIPVALYEPKTDKKIATQKIVIFSHGYGENKGGDNLLYSYLTENLAANGYFVASIQHELPTDSLLATTGIPQITRRSNWERGAENIRFVLNELKKTKPGLDYKNLILIGHSNGGDMTALFAGKYPDLVDKIITMDNRRMALPVTDHPKIYSIRSSDFPADEGVLPNSEDQKKFKMQIVKLNNTKHNEMDNDANAAQRKEINDLIIGFLSN